MISPSDHLRLTTLWPTPPGCELHLTRERSALRLLADGQPVPMSLLHLSLLDLGIRSNAHLTLGGGRLMELRRGGGPSADEDAWLQRALRTEPLFSTLYQACRAIKPRQLIAVPPPLCLSQEASEFVHASFEQAALLRLSRPGGLDHDLQVYDAAGREQFLKYNMLLDLAGPKDISPPSRAEYGLRPYLWSREFTRLLINTNLFVPLMAKSADRPIQVLIPLEPMTF